MKQFDKQQITDLIKYRRSIYPHQFTDEIIDDGIVTEILENAHWAPNHGKTEPWHFYVFKGEGRKLLSEVQADLYQKNTPPEKYKEEKYMKLKKIPLQSSHVIAIIMKRQATEKIPEIEEIEAVACAVQNIYLSVTAFGLGGYWSSGGATYMEETKELFGLCDKDKVLGFFYLGVPKEEYPAGFRSDVAEKITWISDPS